ncbi:Protein Wnt-11b-2 [Toxocara canis]|uniref:Protein Wnt n=1 Tax=Toxocara canis TaxID=6265 RepID=A0A0B2VY93_TOXCA|nr:Protein Wnt-11b-2 [Toxocara canis]
MDRKGGRLYWKGGAQAAFYEFASCALCGCADGSTTAAGNRRATRLIDTMRRIPLVLFLFLSSSFLMPSPICGAIKWLSLHRIVNLWTEPRHCPKSQAERKVYGLVGYQARMCRRISELMPVIIRASQSTVSACQKIFADRRWNCSSILLAPHLKPDLTKGTKEQAYVYALSSAAITHHVAKACVSGDLPYCPCGLNSPTVSADATYKWKGCSDNVLYGQRVSREWADAPWRRKPKGARNGTRAQRIYTESLIDELTFINTDFVDSPPASGLPPRAKMNQHNNDVGRQVTQESLYRKCKCHGVSSSCNVRTCWNTLPDIVDVALKLRERYAEAAEMSELLAESGYGSNAMRGEMSKQHLVYLRKSPDYCVEDKRTGSYGTRMRECNVTSPGADGCGSLCCGRGYNTQQVMVEEQCQCKYVHCCYVKCKTCSYLIDKYYCK